MLEALVDMEVVVMGTYFDEAFDENELKEILRHVFDTGLATIKYHTRVSTYQKEKYAELKKYDAAKEMFDHLLEFRFPRLDETKSLGPAQDYINARKEKK